MSRSGYVEDDGDDPLALGRWRGAVASAIRGKNGQAFFREMLVALDAMPVKRLTKNTLIVNGEFDDVIVGGDDLVARDGEVAAMGDVCAMGAVGKMRGLEMGKVDPENYEGVAQLFGINEKIAQEIAYTNDECGRGRMVEGKWVKETPEERYVRVRAWVQSQIKDGA
jgi:hypothetical protein